MPVVEQDVERIVQLVLERLRAAGVAVQPSAVERPQDHEGTAPKTRLELMHPVISLATLDGQLGKIEELVVHQRAVVTPAVKDELQQRKIALKRTHAPARNLNNSAEPICICLAGAGQASEVAALKQSLSAAGLAARWLADDTLQVAITKLREQLTTDGRLGVLLTDRPALALCMANRNSQLRAAEARTNADAETACRLLDANLLVAHPSRLATSDLAQIIRTFACGDGRHRPAELT